MKGASEAGTAHESSVVQSTSVTSLAHVPSTVSAFFALVKRDLMLSYRHRNELLNPLLFFVIVVILFPLGTSPEKQLLQTMAPGVIWVAALLAAMLSLDTLFKADYDDGTLEQIMLSPHSNSVMVLAKIISHWLVTGVPIILLAHINVNPATGHACSQSGGGDWHGADIRIEPRRYAVVSISPATLYTGADIFSKCGRCQCGRDGNQGTVVFSGGVTGAGINVSASGDCERIKNQC